MRAIFMASLCAVAGGVAIMMLMTFRFSRTVCAFVIGLTGSACASAGAPPLFGPAREQPSALVGRWLDQGTLEVLVLAGNARQWAVSASSVPDSAQAERSGPRAWWWVVGADEAHSRRLCLHWRPGRHAADCESFQIDSVQAEGRWRRRLTWSERSFIEDRRSNPDK